MFPLNIYKTFRAQDSSERFSYYQGIIETGVLPVLADAITHLKVVTQHSDYIFYITPQELGQDSGDSIRIGLAEIYTLLAACQAVDGLGSFAVAYNVDYNASDSNAVRQAWQPGSSFLALRSNGSQRMKDAKTNLLGAATSIQNGISFLIQHPNNGIIPYTPADGPELTDVTYSIDTLQKYLSGAVQVSGDFNNDGVNTNLTIDMASFFDNAIGDFKQKVPAYTVSIQQDGNVYDPVLTWQATSFSTWTFPDPKFNGIFPDITTDAQLKQTFGLTASNWGQLVVISIGG